MKKLENKEIFQNGNSKTSFFSISVSKHFRSYAQLAIAHSSLILTQIGRIDSEISREKKKNWDILCIVHTLRVCSRIHFAETVYQNKFFWNKIKIGAAKIRLRPADLDIIFIQTQVIHLQKEA